MNARNRSQTIDGLVQMLLIVFLFRLFFYISINNNNFMFCLYLSLSFHYDFILWIFKFHFVFRFMRLLHQWTYCRPRYVLKNRFHLFVWWFCANFFTFAWPDGLCFALQCHTMCIHITYIIITSNPFRCTSIFRWWSTCQYMLLRRSPFPSICQRTKEWSNGAAQHRPGGKWHPRTYCGIESLG